MRIEKRETKVAFLMLGGLLGLMLTSFNLTPLWCLSAYVLGMILSPLLIGVGLRVMESLGFDQGADDRRIWVLSVLIFVIALALVMAIKGG